MTKDTSNIDWYSELDKLYNEPVAETEFESARHLKPSDDCVALIESFEGFRSEAYQDSVGVWTIGIGSTRGVKPGDTITYNEAKYRMLDELDKNYASHVRDMVHVEITQGMFDALCSFSYNLGWGALKKSTLLKKLNSGDYDGAADEFLKWNKGRINGELVVLNGLTRRRQAERAMFLGDDWKAFLKA